MQSIDTSAYVGIDPGAQGAVALITRAGLTLWLMPTTERTNSRGKTRDRVCPVGLASILRTCAAAGARTATIEDVWGIKGQGAGSAAALGDAVGVTRACAALCGLSAENVSALRWKAAAGVLKQGKAGAVARAIRAFPDQEALFSPKRGERTSAQAEGLAEAALIALYAKTGGTYGR